MPDYQACPTCGSTLAVASSDEGTQGFVPVDARELDQQLAARHAEVARLREEADGFKYWAMEFDRRNNKLGQQVAASQAEVVRLRVLVVDALDFDHTRGCSGAHGNLYRCKCGLRDWLPKAATALATPDKGEKE